MGQSVSRIRNTFDGISAFTTAASTTDDKAGNLKLEAQRVTAFSGSNEECRKWKNRTMCALEGSGHDTILADGTFANTHPKMN